MPSRMKTAQNLEDRYLGNAPKKNHEKISIVLEIYRGNKKVKKKNISPRWSSWLSILHGRLEL